MSTKSRRWLRRKNNEPKSLEELHYEELREFAQEGSNRYCFDCHQRGPTYVNMTIGSFVCMRCSGLLRGLTPPHRVKSMSMATYSTEEMDFIKERGNDYCTQVWLSLYDVDEKVPSENADEQEIKDFMIQKYERKRYYVDPKITGVELRSCFLEDSLKPTEEEFLKIWRSFPPPGPTKEEFHKTLKECREKNDFGIKYVDPKVIRATADSTTSDFVADFSKAEIFMANEPLRNANNNSNDINTQPSFANFDNNPVFNISTIKPVVQSKLSDQLISPPPSEDRYAALKDLDNALKVQFQDQRVDWSSGKSPINGSLFNTLSQGSSNSLFSSPFTDKTLSTEASVHNPFSVNQLSSTWNIPKIESVQHSSPLMYNANPFKTINGFNGNQLNSSNFSQGSIFHPTTEQTTVFPSQFVQNSNRDNSSVNPFKIGSSSGKFSNNPFL